MTQKECLELAEKLYNDCLEVPKTKGLDYAGLDDGNKNFKDEAKKLGLTPFQIWLVYFDKHYSRILNAIKENPENPKSHGETLRESIKDEIVYLTKLEHLLIEFKPNKKLRKAIKKMVKRLAQLECLLIELC